MAQGEHTHKYTRICGDQVPVHFSSLDLRLGKSPWHILRYVYMLKNHIPHFPAIPKQKIESMLLPDDFLSFRAINLPYLEVYLREFVLTTVILAPGACRIQVMASPG